MKVMMAGYQAISILRGGPDTQLRKTAHHLPPFGIEPMLFDPWRGVTKSDCDVFHLFAANIGTYHLAREVHALGIPLVVSPIIFSVHSHTFIRAVLKSTRLAQRFGKGLWSDYSLAADICGWSSYCLPNTKAEGDILVSGLGVAGEKIRVIPNGVDERFASADPGLFKKTYGLDNFILNVGHIGHERKNVLNLIKALGQIDHPAVIIGRIIKGSYGDACVREAAKHKHILLIDGLDNNSEILASAYAACDVFVLPSLFETPGIAALEAGLAGAKIVITPHGGTREYFGAMAEYVEPDSVDSIRDGIIRSLGMIKNDVLKARIGREYLWSNIADRTAAVYREVIG